MNEKKQIIIFWREKWNTIFNIKKNIPIVNSKQYFSFLLSYHLNIKFPESKKKKKRNKYKLIQKWKKKKIKIHRVKKRTNVSDFKNEKSEWLGWKNRRSNAKSQSAATRFIEFHWPNTFNLRTSVFDEEQRDPWHSRCGARCIHRPFLFETRAGANDSTCSYTSLPREDECSSKYSLDSSLRATNNVHLYVYKVCIKAWVKEFSINFQMEIWSWIHHEGNDQIRDNYAEKNLRY